MKQPEEKIDFDDIVLQDIGYEVTYLVRRIEKIAIALFYQLNEDVNLTPTQYSALGAIRDFSGYEQRSIGRVIDIDRSTINKVTERLAEAGLVKRERKGRDIMVSLTAKGQKMLVEGKKNNAEHRKRFLEPLDKDEKKLFVELMRKVAGRSPMKINEAIANIDK